MKLLFICTHNRCRSILAEAITNHLSSGRILAASAGSSPQDEVHPLSLKYLHERDIPTDGLCSQSWNEFENFFPDAILTLCDNAAEESCPVWFNHSVQVHWGLSDPSVAQESEQRRSFDHTIDVIGRRVERLLEVYTRSFSDVALRDQLSQIATQVV